MQQRFLIKIFSFIFLLSLWNCGNDDPTELFFDPSLVGLDQTNQRLFVIESDRRLSVLNPTTLAGIGGAQPLINTNSSETLKNYLPEEPRQMWVFSRGETSEIWLSGGLRDQNQNWVSNRLQILEFDGTNFSQKSFSPITLTDNNTATTEQLSTPTALFLNSDQTELAICYGALGLVFFLNPNDGSTSREPITFDFPIYAIQRVENQLILATEIGSSLSAEEEEEDISPTTGLLVYNLDSEVLTEVELETSLNRLHAYDLSNNEALILASNSQNLRVYFYRLNLTDFSLTAIASSNEEALSDGLGAGNGITSSVSDLTIVAADSDLFGYVFQTDGVLQKLDLNLNQNQFTLNTLPSVVQGMRSPIVYTNSEGQNILYFVAQISGELLYTEIGSEVINARF